METLAPDVWSMAADAFDPTAGDPLWTPQAKQALATKLAEQVDEVLYGGAAGGGKTEWLIAYMGEEMERHPGNRGVIFRRVYPSLSRSVIPRAKDMYAGRARWNGNDSTFTWPNGSVLQMSHLQYLDSVRDHQGAEYGVIGFEEITEFLKKQYEFMLSRLRAPADGIRPHAIATTNPGGIGHAWVKRHWIAPKAEDLEEGRERPQPFEVWKPAPTTDVPEPGSRVFIPSTIKDNPALERRDPGYKARLRAAITDRGLRQALEDGDWDAIDAVEGALWQQSWLDGGRVSRLRPIDINRTVVALDPSDGDAKTSDEFGVTVASLRNDGVGVVRYSGGWFGSPQDLAKRAVKVYHDFQADVLVVERNHGGKWLPTVLRGVDQYANIQVVWASQGKKTRAEPVAALFQPDKDHRLLYRAVLLGYHEELEQELTHYTGAPGDVSPNRLDATVWALHALLLSNGTASAAQANDTRLRGRR
jgi:hypothetical protein